jgi:hypothetical protein
MPLGTPGARELFDGLLAYSERHAARMDRLLRASYLLDYTLAASGVLLPGEGDADGGGGKAGGDEAGRGGDGGGSDDEDGGGELAAFGGAAARQVGTQGLLLVLHGGYGVVYGVQSLGRHRIGFDTNCM